MTVNSIQCGVHLATGGPDNILVGFIPDMVIMWKSAAIPIFNMWARRKVCAFTSGGTYEVKAGDTIQGATSTGVRATVQQVMLTSGTWAGGDAAGFFVWQDLHQTGTFGAENVDLLSSISSMGGGGGVQTTNVATVAAQAEVFNVSIAGAADPTNSAVTLVTPANGIQPYSGTQAGYEEGFTITATLATAGDLWYWIAFRSTFAV